MVEKFLTFAIGFASGVLYTSAVLEENPNKVIKHAGEDIQHASEVVSAAAGKAVDKVKETFSNQNQQDVQVVEGEVIIEAAE